MPLYQKVFLVLVVALLAYIGISSVMRRRRRPFALAKARRILGSLCGANDFLSMTSPEERLDLLFKACEDADITVDELGISKTQLLALCRSLRQKK